MKLSKLEKSLETKKSKSVFWIIAIVILLLIFSLAFGYFSLQNNTVKSTNNSELGTFKNPEIAFKETQKALQLISEKLNIGIKSVEYINEYEESKNLIFKNKSK